MTPNAFVPPAMVVDRIVAPPSNNAAITRVVRMMLFAWPKNVAAPRRRPAPTPPMAPVARMGCSAAPAVTPVTIRTAVVVSIPIARAIAATPVFAGTIGVRSNHSPMASIAVIAWLVRMACAPPPARKASFVAPTMIVASIQRVAVVVTMSIAPLWIALPACVSIINAERANRSIVKPTTDPFAVPRALDVLRLPMKQAVHPRSVALMNQPLVSPWWAAFPRPFVARAARNAMRQ